MWWVRAGGGGALAGCLCESIEVALRRLGGAQNRR